MYEHFVRILHENNLLYMAISLIYPEFYVGLFKHKVTSNSFLFGLNIIDRLMTQSISEKTYSV